MTPEQFWEHVDQSDGPDFCWPWTASLTTRGGYGQVNFAGKMRRAHRVAWWLAHGEEAPPDKVVCHACDTPACCNPSHLWLGDQAANIGDMWAKGRGHDGTQAEKGEERWNAKLTEEGVHDIRRRAAAGESSTSIALDYPVTATNVRLIVRRKAWKHVA